MGDTFSGFKSFAILAVANFANINSNDEYFCPVGYSAYTDPDFSVSVHCQVKATYRLSHPQFHDHRLPSYNDASRTLQDLSVGPQRPDSRYSQQTSPFCL